MQETQVMAVLTDRVYHELVALTGVVLMAVAGWVRWRLTWLYSDVEEDEKNAKITAAQAKKRMRILSLISPVLMLVGAASLVWVASKHLHWLGF